MSSGNGNTALATALAHSTPPSQLYKQYNPDLQGVLDGKVRDISVIAERHDVPTLSEVAYAYKNTGVAVDWIKVQLEVVNAFTNVQQRLTSEQLIAIGEQVFSLYPDINLLEFTLFCGRLRRGKYEKWYGSVDGQKILISLDAFMRDRMHDIIRRREEVHKKQREEEGSKASVNPLQLIKDNPGKYPTLEAILKNGRKIDTVAKKVKPVRRKNNMSKILSIISNIEVVGKQYIELRKYDFEPVFIFYEDRSVELLSICAFFDNHKKVVGRIPEVNVLAHSLIDGTASENIDIRLDDLDEKSLLKIDSILTTIIKNKKNG